MNTPKNFALQLGALITLYASIAALTTLLFGVITIQFPDAADYSYMSESAMNSIRFSIATLIVVFPAYLWITRTVNQTRRKEEGKYLVLTKWLVYLSLLVGGSILAGDLIAVINGYLNGELTTRFVLKAFVLASVIAAAFYYYLKDAQGYWQTREQASKLFGLCVVGVVVIALALGFANSKPPAEIREARIDNNQIQNLQDIQWRIEEYYRVNETLPESLSDAYRSLPIPQAPDGRSSYVYKTTGTSTYELCATFAQNSTSDPYNYGAPIYEKNYSWIHEAGEWCFERVIEQSQTKQID